MVYIQIALVDKCHAYNGSGRVITPGGSLRSAGSSDDGATPYTSLLSTTGATSPNMAEVERDDQAENFYSYVEVTDLLLNRSSVDDMGSGDDGANRSEENCGNVQPFYSSGSSGGSTSSAGISHNGHSYVVTRRGGEFTCNAANNFPNNEDNNSFLNVSGNYDDEEEEQEDTCSSNGDDSCRFMADFRRDKLGVAAPFSWDSQGWFFLYLPKLLAKKKLTFMFAQRTLLTIGLDKMLLNIYKQTTLSCLMYNVGFEF